MEQREDRDRVVITGLGIVSPVGCGAAPTFQALLEGRSGVVSLPPPLDQLPVHIGAPVAVEDASSALGPKEAKRHARFTQLAAAAADEAVRDAGLRDAGYEPAQLGVIIGVGIGGVEIFAQQVRVLDGAGPTRVWPFTIPALIPNMAAGVLAQWLGAQGHCFCVSSACASSAHAIGEAVHKLRTGVIDAALAGGSEAVLTAPTLSAARRRS